uniref:BOD1/SHG1 domain-containing protein n=1 Tax=Anabas testudineus TaxID=64144 RepID=A0A7N6AY51_ANATE
SSSGSNMAGLPPGDPQLVSMIVNHLKTQGLFDQFRRDCLADVDTKPAYLNLKQRVDNFVSNHLSNHTWSPHLNKNQLRNNIRQLVLQSGMLEQGVDRIVAQVVDPKINHIFRPQVERVVREFLSPGSYSEEPPAPLPSTESKPDSSIPEQGTQYFMSLLTMCTIFKCLLFVILIVTIDPLCTGQSSACLLGVCFHKAD